METRNKNYKDINTEQNLQNLQDPSWWEGFLESGAFLRESGDFVWVWQGLNEDRRIGLHTEFEDNQNISISYMYFFNNCICHLYSDSNPILFPISIFKSALHKYLGDFKTKFRKTQFLLSSQESFEQSFREIFQRLHRGEIDKAVPVIFAHSAQSLGIAPLDKAYWILRTLTSSLDLYAYGFWQKNFGVIGATPEMLFDLNSNTISTMALAGTMPSSERGTRASLLNDSKERHEHDLVVQDLKTQFSQMGSVFVSETHVVDLPNLSHLRTMIRVKTTQQFDEKDCDDMILRLHPTPALGVSPRSYGYSWLEKLPDQPHRAFHGIPIAFHIADRVLCLVSIRNIQWDSREIKIGAGCGLVKDSQLEREWRELVQKIESVYQLLGIE